MAITYAAVQRRTSGAVKAVYDGWLWLVVQGSAPEVAPMLPAMLVLPSLSAAAAAAVAAAVGLSPGTVAPGELPYTGAPGAAENLPEYARGIGGLGAKLGSGTLIATAFTAVAGCPGSDPCTRLLDEVEAARAALDSTAASFTSGSSALTAGPWAGGWAAPWDTSCARDRSSPSSFAPCCCCAGAAAGAPSLLVGPPTSGRLAPMAGNSTSVMGGGVGASLLCSCSAVGEGALIGRAVAFNRRAQLMPPVTAAVCGRGRGACAAAAAPRAEPTDALADAVEAPSACDALSVS